MTKCVSCEPFEFLDLVKHLLLLLAHKGCRKREDQKLAVFF